MVEKPYAYAVEDGKVIERVIDDDPVQIIHMVLPKGEALPEHYSNSNVYMVVVRGTLTLHLDEQHAHSYSRGNVVNIPYHTKMNVCNENDPVLEFFVVKAPNPRLYQEEQN